MKNATIDRTFSILIRESYEYTCQYPSCPDCGNIPGGADDCSHYYGRRYLGGRWLPDNCVVLCRQRHNYLDKHYHEHVDFVRNHIGEDRFQMLTERLQSNYPYSGAEKKEIHAHYRAELKRVRDERKNGKQGHIPLVSYD